MVTLQFLKVNFLLGDNFRFRGKSQCYKTLQIVQGFHMVFTCSRIVWPQYICGTKILTSVLNVCPWRSTRFHLLQISSVSPLMSFLSQDPIQNPMLRLVAMSPKAPLDCHSFSVFLCLSQIWQCWRALMGSFVEGPSIWAPLMFSHN